MSAGLNVQYVRAYYQKMPDSELIQILTQDAAGLTPQAFEVVKEEITKRNLDNSILKGVEAQQKSYTINELDKYCELIQNLPCPKTGNVSEKLNGTLTAQVMSFIVITHYKKKIIIACPKALHTANNEALLTTVLLGWWGIPWGIIRAIQAIVINIRSKKTNRADTPNNYLRSFVLSKIGEIETYKDDQGKLLEIISRA